jgi:hypothetical protein
MEHGSAYFGQLAICLSKSPISISTPQYSQSLFAHFRILQPSPAGVNTTAFDEANPHQKGQELPEIFVAH